MSIFFTTLNQTAVMLSFIILGYLLAKGKYVPDNSQEVLSKLENTLLIPALVLGTFLENFSVQKIQMARDLFACSLLLEGIVIVFSLFCVRICAKERYARNIYLYGLCFSNFGFMGNAVVSAIYPEYFLDYLIFQLPLWILIYLWGVPVLLMDDGAQKTGIRQKLKNFVNPLFLSMLIGMVIGLLGIPVPGFLRSVISSASGCMSPVAMLLTGMVIARFDLGKILKIKGVYIATFLRLLAFPLAFLAVLKVVPMPEAFATCAVCCMAMPLGLNTIVIPEALGKDTRIAAGMALVSHLLSCLTIPLIFFLFEKMI